MPTDGLDHHRWAGPPQMGWTATDVLECMYGTIEQANAFHSPLVTYTQMTLTLDSFHSKKVIH